MRLQITTRSASTRTRRRWSYPTATDAVTLSSPGHYEPSHRTPEPLLAVSPVKELMREKGNSLWRNMKQSIKGAKARQWRSRRAGPFQGMLGFILQETMWVFSYSFSTQELGNNLVPSYCASLFLPMPHTAAPTFWRHFFFFLIILLNHTWSP